MKEPTPLGLEMSLEICRRLGLSIEKLIILSTYFEIANNSVALVGTGPGDVLRDERREYSHFIWPENENERDLCLMGSDVLELVAKQARTFLGLDYHSLVDFKALRNHLAVYIRPVNPVEYGGVVKKEVDL